MRIFQKHLFQQISTCPSEISFFIGQLQVPIFRNVCPSSFDIIPSLSLGHFQLTACFVMCSVSSPSLGRCIYLQFAPYLWVVTSLSESWDIVIPLFLLPDTLQEQQSLLLRPLRPTRGQLGSTTHPFVSTAVSIRSTAAAWTMPARHLLFFTVNAALLCPAALGRRRHLA